MPRLLLKNRCEVIKEYFWKIRNKITIGSSKKANIYINDLSNILNEHCFISKVGDTYYITDNQTLTGTFVNGKIVSGSTQLKFNDEITFGQSEYSMLFLPDERAEEEIYLLGIYGKFYGKKYILKSINRVGRTLKNPQNELNDIVLSSDETVSKGHCKIFIEDGRIYITDVGSTCGTLVNDEKISYFDKVELNIKDEICIGRSIFRLCSGNKLDYSYPKKQKVLLLKTLSFLKLFFLGVVLIFCLYSFINSLAKYIIFTRKNNDIQLQATTKYFIGNEEYIVQTSTESQISFLCPSIGLGHFNKDKIADLAYLDKRGFVYAWNGATGVTLWPPRNYMFSEFGGLVVGDINNDKIDDLVFVTADNRLISLDGFSGVEIFKEQLQSTVNNFVPCIFDIDLDGKKDVVVCSEEGTVYLIYSAGYLALRNIKTVPTKGPIYASPVIVSSKKISPIVVVCNYNGELFLIDGKNGTTKQLNLNSLTKKPHFVSVAAGVGDVNGDDVPELVFATTLPQYVTCIDIIDSKALWSYFVEKQPLQEIKYFSSPIVMDFDNDGKNEVVFVSPTGNLYCFSGESDFSGGELLWSLSLDASSKGENFIVSQPAVGNLFGGLSYEIICGDSLGYIYLITAENNKGRISLQNRFFKEESIVSPILLGDVNGDGKIGIVYATKDNIIRVINTQSKSLKGNILNSCYLYSSGHFYYNVEDAVFQSKMIFINLGIIIILLTYLKVEDILNKKKFEKKKLL